MFSLCLFVSIDDDDGDDIGSGSETKQRKKNCNNAVTFWLIRVSTPHTQTRERTLGERHTHTANECHKIFIFDFFFSFR